MKNLHDASIQEHIRQKAGWDTSHFNKIHWDAHERASHTLPRFTRYNTAKLIHGLINTNKQNNLYYGTSLLCPICKQEIETKEHVFKCSNPSAAPNRHEHLTALLKTLKQVNLDQNIVKTINYGFTAWSKDQQEPVRPPTAGSLRGPDAVLMTAFHKQYRILGWYHMCMGRISKKWSAAAMQYTKESDIEHDEYWASIIIRA